MSFEKFQTKNNSYSTLLNALSSWSTTVVVDTDEWAIFPSTYPFLITIEQFNSSWIVIKREVLKVSNRVDDTMTVVRAYEHCIQDDTTNPKTQTQYALDFSAWDKVSMYYTSWLIDDIQDQIYTNQQDIATHENQLNDVPNISKTETNFKWWVWIAIDEASWDIAQTSNWRIEDEKYWVYLQEPTWNASAEFDSSITRTWKFTLKMSNLNSTWTWQCFINSARNTANLIIKPNTKYKISCWARTYNVASNSAYIWTFELNSSLWWITSHTSSKLSWTNDWTYIEDIFTSNASSYYLQIYMSNNVAWNISDVWYDINSLRLEEIIESQTDTINDSSQWVIWLKAVSSYDNIDQTIWWTGNTYTVPTSINEWATHRQTFTPTKKKQAKIKINVVADWWQALTLTIHDTSNNVIATQSKWSIWTWDITFDIPRIWTSWAYHFHLTVPSWTTTINTNVSSDLEWCQATFYYAKNTTWFIVSENWETINLNTDEDWLLNWSIIDLANWKYIYENSISDYWINAWLDLYNWNWAINYSNNSLYFQWWTDCDLIYKVNTLFPCNNFQINTEIQIWNARSWNIYYSLDWINYTELYIWDISSWDAYSWSLTFNIDMWWATIVYIKFSMNYISALWSIFYIDFYWDIDISSLPILYNYPTWINLYETYVWFTSFSINTVYYRKNKYWFPALEFSEWNYIFLQRDTYEWTSWSSYTYIKAKDWSTWWSYTQLWDWDYISISSTTNPIIDTIEKIQYNRIYISSNDINASSTLDWSLQWNVIFQSKNQWIKYDIIELKKENNEQNKWIDELLARIKYLETITSRQKIQRKSLTMSNWSFDLTFDELSEISYVLIDWFAWQDTSLNISRNARSSWRYNWTSWWCSYHQWQSWWSTTTTYVLYLTWWSIWWNITTSSMSISWNHVLWTIAWVWLTPQATITAFWI